MSAFPQGLFLPIYLVPLGHAFLFICFFLSLPHDINNACVSMKCISKPNIMWWFLEGRAFESDLSHRGGALIKEIKALIKEIPESSFTFLPRGQDGHLWTRKRIFTRHQICWRLYLRLSASRTERFICCCKPLVYDTFSITPDWGILWFWLKIQHLKK